MTRNGLILLAAGGSLLLLLGAWGFQYIGGLAPCKLCLWQRWPHEIAVLAGVLALVFGWRIWPALGALAALSTAAIGGYHTGVERGWWQGPSTCTGGGTDLFGMSGADLLSTQGKANIIMCDEVAWQMFTLSMPTWNMLASLGLAALWVMASRRATPLK